VPGYRLLERVGVGGAGEVWSAEAPGGLRVALKIVRLAGELGQREMSNLRILRAIRHPNLLAYFGAWQAEGRLIIGMELADRSLWDRFAEAAGQGQAGIPRGELLEVLGEVAKVIDFLNEPRHQLEGRSGVAIHHRDIKPQNIMLIGQGVKLADFGLSCLGGPADPSRNKGGWTVSYAAPETFRRQTAGTSDQYSLAVTYCQLRGGRLPFLGTPTSVMLGHLFGAPELTRLPDRERPVVARALAKDPSRRWPDCRSFVRALAECAAKGSPECLALGRGGLPEAPSGSSSIVIPPLRASDPEDPSDPSSIVIPPLPAPWADPASSPSDAVPFDEASVDRVGPLSRPAPPGPLAIATSSLPTLVAASSIARDPGRIRRLVLVAASVLATASALWSWQFASRAAVPSARGDRAASSRAAATGPPGPADRGPAPGIAATRVSWDPGPPPVRIRVVTSPSWATPPPAPRLGPAGDEPRAGVGSRTADPSIALDWPLARWAPLMRRAWVACHRRITDLAAARGHRPGPGELRLAGANALSPARPTPTPTPADRPAPHPAAQGASPLRPEAAGPAPESGLRLILPATLRLEAGGSASIPIRVTRGAFTGPLLVQFQGLPSGVWLADLTIPAGQDRAEARARARLDAASASVPVQLVARAGPLRGEATVRLEVRANAPMVQRARGHTLLACGRPAQAIAAFTQAIAAGTSDPMVYNNRALAYSLLSRFDLAITDYDAASRLQPENPVIRYNRGVAFARRGDDARALADLDPAIHLDPAFARAYEARARIHLKRGDAARFQADSERATQLTRSAARDADPRPPAPSPPPPYRAASRGPRAAAGPGMPRFPAIAGDGHGTR
jgi:serine/threonine protein kinase/Tfp pilus assembly protein PilF